MSTAHYTEAHLDTLRHMLGINTPERERPKPYRDYYCANPDDSHMRELENLGFVCLCSKRGGYWWYTTTDAGRSVALASFKSIRWSRGRRRYIDFLRVHDVLPDLSFGDFLKNTDLQQ